MNLTLDDRGDKCKLTITNGSKTVYKKTGTIKSLLGMVYRGTKKDNVKQSILQMQSMYMFMQKSLTNIEIKD